MTTGERRWISFDGLRAILVMGVMAHHVEWTLGDTTPIFEAGWLPVDGFFVLSGFLIANALLRQYEREGEIDIAGFLARRLARIYPALLVVLGAIGVVAVVADDRPITHVWPSLASAASIGHNYNYSTISPLLTEVGPLWSLSIELQFYVVFPLVAFGLLARRTPRRRWVGIVVAVIVVSASWRGLLGVERFPDSYLWTQVRLDSLMWGVLIALALQWRWLDAVRPATARVLGALSIVTLISLYLTMGGFDDATYDWGITAAGVASAGLVGFLVVAPRSWCATALSWRPLVALGRRSYSAYLWHQAVFLFLMRHTATGPWTRPVVGFIVTFALADLTYRFVEQPVLTRYRHWSSLRGGTRRRETMSTTDSGFV